MAKNQMQLIENCIRWIRVTLYYALLPTYSKYWDENQLPEYIRIVSGKDMN
jgi:hypothetical protein